MNAQKKIVEGNPLALLRQPFAHNHISKLPKETRAQIDARKGDNGRSVMVFNCPVCGGHHHKDAVHLDYVGHAALTDRLLDTDIEWSWEPVGFTPEGLPAHDKNGGLWIKLTVCGVTRYGYGSADGKSGGDAVKEIIGDALRNAAMRFGAALDLWHKGDLHPEETREVIDQDTGEITTGETHRRDPPIPGITKIRNNLNKLRRDGGKATDLEAFNTLVSANKDDLQKIKDAEHTLWTGMGEDFDGFKSWIKRRREELAPQPEHSLGLQMLLSVLDTCETRGDLNALLEEHGSVAEQLDGEESRKWERAFNEREAAIMAIANVGAG